MGVRSPHMVQFVHTQMGVCVKDREVGKWQYRHCRINAERQEEIHYGWEIINRFICELCREIGES